MLQSDQDNLHNASGVAWAATDNNGSPIVFADGGEKQERRRSSGVGNHTPPTDVSQIDSSLEKVLREAETQARAKAGQPNGKENSAASPPVGPPQDERDGIVQATASPLQSGGADAPDRMAFDTPPPDELPSTSGGVVTITDKEMSLSNYLTEELCEAYSKSGFKGKLYKWQAECLNVSGVLSGRSIIYSAPTSGGKTLVAEILMLKRIIASKRQAMLVLPFVALCEEKANHLETLTDVLGKEVYRLYGHHKMGRTLPGSEYGIIVCTIEKANALVTRMIEEQNIQENLCAIVIDELHMIGDSNRGHILELMLSKVKHASQSNLSGDVQLPTQERIQFVGMSATLPNVEGMATWLEAELFMCDHRPVPLRHMICSGGVLKDEKLQEIRKVERHPKIREKTTLFEMDAVCSLAWETLAEGHSVLVFCPTKKECMMTAQKLAKQLEIEASKDIMDVRESIAYEMEQVSKRQDLLTCIRMGVGYHHGDLSPEERSGVERAYRKGACKVLAATSTLAAGVNLPARRVIFRHPYTFESTSTGLAKVLLPTTKYKQMAGRAGRAGIDTFGEAILVCTTEYGENRVQDILNGEDTPVRSCLSENGQGLRRSMLEAICSGLVKSPDDVIYYLKCTLLCWTEEMELVAEIARKALEWLCKNRCARWLEKENVYEPTTLGKALGFSGLDPKEGLLAHRDIRNARKCLILENDLHLLYLISPVIPPFKMGDGYGKWEKLVDVWSASRSSDHLIFEAVGLDHSFMNKVSSRGSHAEEEEEKRRKATRLYSALILRDLVREVEPMEISKSFGVTVSQVHVLQELTVVMASMTIVMCQRLGWGDMEALMDKFQSRISFGVQSDVLGLAEIPGLKPHKARILYKSGLRSPEDVVHAGSIEQIAKILFDGSSQRQTKDKRKRGLAFSVERKCAKRILSGAQDLMQKKAKELEKQALMYKSIKKDPLFSLTPTQNEKGLREIKTVEDLRALQERIAQCKRVSFLLHISRRHSAHQELLGVALGLSQRSVVYLPLSQLKRDHLADVSVEFQDMAWRVFLSNVLDNDGVEKATWGLKEQIKTIRRVCTVRETPWEGGKGLHRCFDLRIAAWLLKPDSNIFSDSLTNEIKCWDQLETLLKEMSQCNGSVYACVIQGYVARGVGTFTYTCRNAACLFDLADPLLMHLEKEDLLDCFNEIEMPLVPVLVQMETVGVPFNSKIYAAAIPALTDKLRALSKKAYASASLPGQRPHSFDLNSPSAISNVLFQRLRLPPPPGSESKKSGGLRVTYSTRKEVLQQLSSIHDLPGIILEHRQLSKLLNTMQKALPEYERMSSSQIAVSCSMASSGGKMVNMTRIKGTFLQTTSESGRLHMDEPNLQCVPNPKDINLASQQILGPGEAKAPKGEGEGATTLNVNVRSAFQTIDDYVVLSTDYAQLELRLMAHFSKDEVLLASIRSGQDLFVQIAAKWQGVDESAVTPEMRTKAKRLCYGILYGMGAERLAGELKCDMAKAREQAEAFKRCLRGVDKWKEQVNAMVMREGHIQTLGGRKRFFKELAPPALTGQKKKMKEVSVEQKCAALRQAVNTTCQGSASDIMKRAMVNIQRRVSASPQLRERCHMILEIHDELLFEIRRTCLDEAALLIKHEMETAWPGLDVPLEVRIKVGTSWGNGRDFEPKLQGAQRGGRNE